jgi:hydroxyacylglutathione hydrolase|mmetsp:Transcript_15812/g.2621  ORF Transcript_15812/g.2621 Transcript_15812/m.2621 type:complete len:89 (+) Transcript_15812:462-728(+)
MLGETKITGYHTPGHTTGSTSYYIEDDPGLLFTGDTFFLGGMGAFFEGTGRTVLSTISKLLTFPDTTLMFPGHEYSDTTLKFALYIEP